MVVAITGCKYKKALSVLKQFVVCGRWN